IISICAPEERIPVESKFVLNHHPANILKPRERHIEGVVNKDKVLDPGGRQYLQFPFDALQFCQIQGSGEGRIPAKRAFEGAAPSGSNLNSWHVKVWIEGGPVDHVLIHIIVLNHP